MNDKFVLINVGRMTEQKNQLFVIELLNELINNGGNESIELLLIGDGPLHESICKKISEYHLEKYVIILKNRDDVNDLMSASDIFVFPSIYEGLGIVAIEAQTNGLPTICSEFVPEEANASNLYKKIELEKFQEWCDFISKIKKIDRSATIEDVKKNGYDIIDCANELENYYLGEVYEK